MSADWSEIGEARAFAQLFTIVDDVGRGFPRPSLLELCRNAYRTFSDAAQAIFSRAVIDHVFAHPPTAVTFTESDAEALVSRWFQASDPIDVDLSAWRRRRS